MIIGKMDGLQAKVEIVFFLPNGGTIALEFVVDTGFVGELTLPQSAIGAMNLPFEEFIDTNLADDSGFSANAHRATILWHGQAVSVLVLGIGRRPSPGTAPLKNYELSAQFKPNGRVEINDLP